MLSLSLARSLSLNDRAPKEEQPVSFRTATAKVVYFQGILVQSAIFGEKYTHEFNYFSKKKLCHVGSYVAVAVSLSIDSEASNSGQVK